MVGSGRGCSPAERGAGPAPVTREVLLPFAASPPPTTNSSLLSLSPLLVLELISLLALQLSWCLPHAGHCSGAVGEGGGSDDTPSHLARGEVQEGGDFQCSGILALSLDCEDGEGHAETSS